MHAAKRNAPRGGVTVSPHRTVPVWRDHPTPLALRAIDPPPPGEGRNADAALTVAFGNACTDDELATVANYVTGRFGKKGSKLTAKDVAELRKQTAE